jgi:hypothetical protein
MNTWVLSFGRGRSWIGRVFGHVRAFRLDPVRGGFVHLDFSGRWVDVGWQPQDPAWLVGVLRARGERVLLVKLPGPDYSEGGVSAYPLTCVTLAARAMGVPGWFWTPGHLARALVRRRNAQWLIPQPGPR